MVLFISGAQIRQTVKWYFTILSCSMRAEGHRKGENYTEVREAKIEACSVSELGMSSRLCVPVCVHVWL